MEKSLNEKLEILYRQTSIDDLQKKYYEGYHYTSPSGLKGIINSGTIYFSDAQCLNDKKELVFINEIFNNARDKYKRSRISRLRMIFLFLLIRMVFLN